MYVPGCPHHQPAFEQLAKVLASESLSAEICQVAVNTEAQTKLCYFRVLRRFALKAKTSNRPKMLPV